MTEEQGAEQDVAQVSHQMLLRLAGRAPDELLTRCRDWLADGELGDLARCVTFWAAATDAGLTEEDVFLLSALLDDAGADSSWLTQIRLDNSDPFPYYAFAPQIPAELDDSAGDESRPAVKARAKAEQAALKAVAAEPGAIGMWHAWRFPCDLAPWPPPRQVFVVEVAATADEPGVAARMQRRLATAGEDSPQVEVYHTGHRLPAYHEFARSEGELVWAAAKDPGIQVAAVFDEADPETGARFRPDHALLDENEAGKIAQYLYAGEPLLVTTGQLDDVVDTSQSYCVPTSFRTDGTWVWTEASAYYAERHRLEPDPGLLAHLRSSDYTLPEVDGVAVYRALAVLQVPADERPVWTPGTSSSSARTA
jgi:hypothetical protein